jgi:hypothetical protein
MFMQKLRSAQIAAFVAIATLPGLALAQGATDPFTTAIDTATDKVTDYAGALVVLGAVAVVFMIALKYVKKIVKAA